MKKIYGMLEPNQMEIILLKGKTYPYLFWEADSYNPQETNEGFIVTGEFAEQFLEEKH